LLHELIHAFLFVGPARNTDHDDHGPNFCHHVRTPRSATPCRFEPHRSRLPLTFPHSFPPCWAVCLFVDPLRRCTTSIVCSV
jgi:hypothetical protein